MTDNLDERLRSLEEKVETIAQLLEELSKIQSITQDQIMMLANQCGSHYNLFAILIKIGIIDQRKYKEEYEQFLFLFKESEGFLKNVGRKTGLGL